MSDGLDQIEKDGADAARANRLVDVCPYTFNKSPFFTRSAERLMQAEREFTAKGWRDKMDAWMKGYLAKKNKLP